MLPTRVRFDGVAGEFEIRLAPCPNMDCTCRDVSVELRRVDGTGGQRLAFMVDAELWQEVSAPERGSSTASLVQEFLSEFPAPERARIAAFFHEKRVISEQLRRYVLPADVGVDGELVSFEEVANPDETFTVDGYLRLAWRVEIPDGSCYMAIDNYCVNPQCGCRGVTVSFHDIKAVILSDNSAPAPLAFAARVSLDGAYELLEVRQGTREDAAHAVEVWRERFPEHMGALQWRYEKMHQIGRRSGRCPPVSTPASSEQTPGRNEPCPCGSGRKYKNCCAR